MKLEDALKRKFTCKKKTQVIRISREPGPVLFTVDEKQVGIVEYCNNLASMINGTRCTREIKSRITVAELAFSKKKTLFTRKFNLNLVEKRWKWYILWC
jgi:hypothetical protein